jgi:acetyl-CoA carboxylase alpha subunit
MRIDTYRTPTKNMDHAGDFVWVCALVDTDGPYPGAFTVLQGEYTTKAAAEAAGLAHQVYGPEDD